MTLTGTDLDSPLGDTADAAGARSRRPQMQVRKRAGDSEPVDVNKIVRAVERHCEGLSEVDPMRVATKTISGLYDGATTAELDRLSIQTAAEMTAAEPEYSRLAGAAAGHTTSRRRSRDRASPPSASRSARPPRGTDRRRDGRVRRGHAPKLDRAVDPLADRRFEYFGLRTVYDRYLLRHPADPAGDRDTAVLPAASRVWAVPNPGGGDRLLPADVVPCVPAEFADAVQRRHPAHAAVGLLPGRLTPRRARLDLRPVCPGRQAVQVRRRHRHLLLAGPRPRRR